MGPFPFINFEQAEINGNFGDEHAYRKVQLQTLVSLFVDDYFLGDRFFVSVNEIRNEVELLNQAPIFASLELVLPSPYPTSTGVEVYTLEITIQQQTDYIPSFIAITFDLTDGIVTSSTTVFTTGLTKEDSATNRPFIDEELKLARTLSVYNQNGAAIFPDTFTYNPTTGIAERRLLRAYDWEYNTTTNRPQRDGITDLRMIPKTVFRLRELTQIEKAMVSFFLEKPIKQSIIEDIWNAKNIYLTPLPEDWTFDFITHSLTKKQLSISSAKYGISFILAGIKVSDLWYFQRFVNPNYTKSNIQTSFEWIIAMNSFTGEYRNVGDIMSLIDVNLSDIILYGANEQFTPQTALITIPFASIVTFPTTVLFADSIINYLNANGLPTTYTIATISGEQVVKFVTTANIVENGIVAVTSFDNAPFSYAIFEGAPPNLAQGLSGTTPSNPNYGKLYSTDYYYDFDQCEFGTVVNEEPFNLTIKSADAYQINIATDFIFDPAIDPESTEAPRIGIFDCNGKYLQDIGKIGFPPVVFPDCIETFTTKIFFPAADNATRYWNWPTVQLVSAPGLAFLKMYLVDSNLNETFEAEFSMEFGPGADLNTFDVAVFCTELQSLITGLGYACVVTYVEGDVPPPQIEPQITVEITADLCNTVAINFVFTYTFVGTLYTHNVGLYTPIVLPEQPVLPTQYQASLTIPPLANGIYRIGVYNQYFIDEVNYITLFAMSQPLQLDNFETFTQILEYGSAKDSIIEGFEYLNGWIQRIRVALNGAGQTYALEESIYRNSDGTFQKPQNSTDEIIYLHTEYFDLKTQRAMTSATRHPIFVLANQNLSVQGDLEIATNQDYTTNQSFRKLQQMRFQAKNQGYQPNNNSCLG
jgi:hypothetical protein